VTPWSIGGIVFVCVFGGALLGMYLRTRLSQHHLSSESKDLVRLGVGLIGTMSALVLGLLVASAKGSYDTQRSELIQMSSKIVVLDRVLAHYGPETKEARDLLRLTVTGMLEQFWPGSVPRRVERKLPGTGGPGESFFDKVQALAPQNDAQRSLQTQAVSLAMDMGQTRWLMFEQAESSISMPLLLVVVFWLTIIFMSFGLFAQPHALAIGVLFISAISVSAAIFLILELDQPFGGLIQISSAPLRNALALLGR
jgi:Protein of unknown function (DUF4239)